MSLPDAMGDAVSAGAAGIVFSIEVQCPFSVQSLLIEIVLGMA